MAEQGTHKPLVVSSNLTLATVKWSPRGLLGCSEGFMFIRGVVYGLSL